MAEVKHSERAHALLSASSAERWMNCTPSARLEDNYPNAESEFSAEGTLAHEYAEILLKKATGAERPEILNDEIDRIVASKFYNKEFEMYVQDYVNYILTLMQYAKDVDPNALIMTEARLDFSNYVPEGFGTGDFSAVAAQRGVVADLKFGKGVKKFAEQNEQLMCYALGLLGLRPDILEFTLIIHQPRLEHVSVWNISTYDLLLWAETELKPKADLAWQGGGDVHMGNWCKFCKHKTNCNALLNEFEDLDKVTKNVLPFTEDVKHRILMYGAMVESLIKSVRAEALVNALHGNAPKGFKAVEGKGSRTFTDKVQVASRLLDCGVPNDVIYKERELNTLTNIERALGKKNFEAGLSDLIRIQKGSPTLVLEEDKREAITSASDFDDLDVIEYDE